MFALGVCCWIFKNLLKFLPLKKISEGIPSMQWLQYCHINNKETFDIAIFIFCMWYLFSIIFEYYIEHKWSVNTDSSLAEILLFGNLSTQFIINIITDYVLLTKRFNGQLLTSDFCLPLCLIKKTLSSSKRSSRCWRFF